MIIKKVVGLLVVFAMVLTPIKAMALTVDHVQVEPVPQIEMAIENLATISMLGINQHASYTGCALDHDHASEICKVPHKGTFLNWENTPYVWEYNWENSANCWYHGMWYNGVKYTTPENTYDIDVRNKVSLYCDGEYLYVNVMQATVNASAGMASDLNITIDGVSTKVQFAQYGQITAPGQYEMTLKHGAGSISGQDVAGSITYLYIKDTNHNSEYETKIPLAELKAQNPNIDLDNVNEITFFSPNFMSKPFAITGISTFPYALAILCLAGVSIVVYKRTKKQKAIEA